MALVPHEDVAEALAAQPTDDPLRDGIRLGFRKGLSTVSIPNLRAREVKSPPNFGSRSRMT